MIAWVLGNTLVAAVLAGLVALVCRRQAHRPALCHLLWLLVLVALVAPPLPLARLPGATLRDGLARWLAPPAVEQVVPAPLATAPEQVPAALPTPSRESAAPAPSTAPPAASGSPGPLASLRTWVAGLDATGAALALWVAGSVLALLLQVLAVLRFRRRLAVTSRAPGELREAVASLARRLGVRAPPVVLFDGLGTPAVWCLGAPQLLWPRRPSGPRQLAAGDRSLLAHELAHLARGDHWVARLESLAAVVLWWHPLLWLARRQLHAWSELSADAWALWAAPDGRAAFARALVEAQATHSETPALPPLQGLCATGRDIQDFERRLTMIMTSDVSRRVPRAAAGLALAICLALLPGFSDERGETRPGDARDAVAAEVRDHVLAKKAEHLFQEGRHDDAFDAFSKLVAARPDHGQAHGRLAYLLIGQGRHEQALEHLARQTELGHQPAVAAYNTACARSLLGQAEAALDDLGRAVALGFHDAQLLATDADLDAARGAPGFAGLLETIQRSDALHRQLAGLDEDDPARLEPLAARAAILTDQGEFQHEAGLALLAAGRLDEARQAFARQAAAGYAPANGHYNLACAQALSGDRDAALTSLERAADLGMVLASVRDDADLASLADEPRFAALADRIAAPGDTLSQLKGALKRGDLAAAQALWEQAGAVAEPNPWASMALGKLLLNDGRAGEAREQFLLALEVGHEADDAVFHVALAEAAAGEDACALSCLDHALTLGFSDGEALAWLLDQHDQLGDAATRLALLERVQAAARPDAYGQAKEKKAWKDKPRTQALADRRDV